MRLDIPSVRPRRGSTALVLLASALVLSSACERRGGETADPAAATGPIKVGVYMDLSGQTSGFGQSSVKGAQMAADEVNAAGGVLGRQIELVIEDDQGRPEQAATVVTKLINQDDVVALIGEIASSNSLAAAPIAQRSQVPMITPASTNPKVTAVGDYIFRICFIDPFQGEVMAQFAYMSLRAREAALLIDVNSDYSRGLAQYFEEAFVKAGGTIVAKQSYQQTDRDFTGQLTTLRAANPDVIFVPGYYSQTGVIARQAKQLGIDATLLGGDGWDAPQLFEIGGDALDGAFISNHYSVDDPSPRIQQFVNDFKGLHSGEAPDAMAVLTYDAVKVLADAIARAGSTDPEELRDALAATRGFEAVSGKISINAERNAIKPAVVLELRDGKYHYRETINPLLFGAVGAPAGVPVAPASPLPAGVPVPAAAG